MGLTRIIKLYSIYTLPKKSIKLKFQACFLPISLANMRSIQLKIPQAPMLAMYMVIAIISRV